ncbi:LysR family transcriptional regulator [Lysinimonas soli]|uniref:LysR family transcriptional regulator n=1 Tax=Lysinimonas soli TaxID=1074233 RepID=A0ABW0NRX0_9MICO
MDLRQLEYFLAVAEEQQFTRAAALRRVSQSGLSASIRTLEDELQAPLFIRTTRSVELTDAGRALLPHARSLIAQAAAGRDAVVATRGDVTGELRIGAEQCIGVVDVPELLGRFHARYPKVRVGFQQAGALELMDQLRAGAADVVFVADAASGPRSAASSLVTRRELATEPMIALCSPQSPLAKRSRVTLPELAGEVFVDFEPSWAIRAINDAAFGERGLTREVRFTVNDVHTLLDLVHRRLGVALVPRPIASKPQAEGLVSVPLERAFEGERLPEWTLSVATIAGDRDAGVASRLIELLPESSG